ncbi:MAG TPA: S-adenosylmethionine decarboxylase [Candidatus Paceibacterota bacterium]
MDGTMWYLGLYTPITDPILLEECFGGFLKRAGFKVLGGAFHPFEPQGYTSFKILGESHESVHTFPEHGRTYVDVLSCIRSKIVQFHELIKPFEESGVVCVVEESIIVPPTDMKTTRAISREIRTFRAAARKRD